jgi:hypothetical protein
MKNLKYMLIGLFGFVFFALGTGFGYYQYQLSQRTTEGLQGTVISFNRGSKGALAPVVEYTYKDVKHTYAHNNYSSPPQYKQGENILIYINPDNPKEVYIKSAIFNWIMPTVFGGIGFLIMVFGGIAYRNRTRA